jgi:hypothetical protein
MLIETALMLEIQRTNPRRVDENKAALYSGWVVEQAREHNLDPWLLHSLIYVESRWVAKVVRLEGDKSCSVGLGQINVADCNEQKIRKLQDPHENLRHIGARLELLQRTCKKNCEGLGWLQGYNPGSKSYVRLVETVLRRCHDDHESIVREVHARLHVPGLRRDGRCGASAECRPRAGTEHS